MFYWSVSFCYVCLGIVSAQFQSGYAMRGKLCKGDCGATAGATRHRQLATRAVSKRAPLSPVQKIPYRRTITCNPDQGPVRADMSTFAMVFSDSCCLIGGIDVHSPTPVLDRPRLPPVVPVAILDPFQNDTEGVKTIVPRLCGACALSYRGLDAFKSKSPASRCSPVIALLSTPIQPFANQL